MQYFTRHYSYCRGSRINQLALAWRFCSSDNERETRGGLLMYPRFDSGAPVTPVRMPCGRTRREFLWEAGGGFAGLALTALLSEDGFFARTAGGAEGYAENGNPCSP